jgi:hypothetical protein
LKEKLHAMGKVVLIAFGLLGIHAGDILLAENNTASTGERIGNKCLGAFDWRSLL